MSRVGEDPNFNQSKIDKWTLRNFEWGPEFVVFFKELFLVMISLSTFYLSFYFFYLTNSIYDAFIKQMVKGHLMTKLTEIQIAIF